MAALTLRSVKGSELTAAEIDANFTNLNTDKLSSTAAGYPAIRTSLNLDFANSQSVDPRITFTRASTATRVRQDGLVEVVASGSPRIDFDPVTQVCKGLLIEEQRTNLLTYSENFDNAAWAKNNATITANATTAPDGTLTADKMVQDTANTAHLVKQGAITTNTNPLSATIYAKAGERTNLLLQLQENTSFARYAFCVFDLTTGTAGSVTNSGGASSSTASCTSVGNGWFRCSIISTLGGVDTNSQLVALDGVSLATYTGDGTSGIYIWGAQLEVGAFPTSYIPTVASQVTRSADTAVMTGTNFSSWYNQTEGTVLVDYDMETSTIYYPSAWYMDDGALNRFGHSVSSGLKNCNYDSSTNSVAQLYLSLGAMPTTVLSAYAYKENDFVGCANGGTVLTDTSGVQPIVNKLQIGGRLYGAFLNGHISKLSYYPKRLTNSELQALTTG